jgi:cytochrome bd-type quinol oxidase subunit 2
MWIWPGGYQEYERQFAEGQEIASSKWRRAAICFLPGIVVGLITAIVFANDLAKDDLLKQIGYAIIMMLGAGILCVVGGGVLVFAESLTKTTSRSIDDADVPRSSLKVIVVGAIIGLVVAVAVCELLLAIVH